MNDRLHVKPLAMILATLFLSAFGGIWYGAIFGDLQMEAHRYTEADYVDNNPLWYIGGVVISLFIAWGITMLVRLGGTPGVMGGIRASVRAVIGFGLPLITYPLVFSPLHDFKLYAVGASQIVIAWIVAGAIIGSLTRERVS